MYVEALHEQRILSGNNQILHNKKFGDSVGSTVCRDIICKSKLNITEYCYGTVKLEFSAEQDTVRNLRSEPGEDHRP